MILSRKNSISRQSKNLLWKLSRGLRDTLYHAYMYVCMKARRVQTRAVSGVSPRGRAFEQTGAGQKLRNESEGGRERWTQERRRYSENSQRGQVRCCAAGGRPQRRAGSEQVVVPLHRALFRAMATQDRLGGLRLARFRSDSHRMRGSRRLAWLSLIAEILIPMYNIPFSRNMIGQIV